MNLDLAKVSEFESVLAGKSAAFIDTLDSLLSNAESNANLKAFVTAHFPAALTWEAELHHVVTVLKNAELRVLPEVTAVLAFLSSLQPKVAA